MRQDGNEGIWQIPESNQHALVKPAAQDWQEVARRNRQLNGNLYLRRQILAGAAVYTSEVLAEEVKFGGDPADQPVLVTGHQPRFYHPGVWFKNFLVAEVAGQMGAIAVNLVVDTDEVGALDAAIPVLDARWQQLRIPLFTARANETFEHLLPPSPAQIGDFARKIEQVAVTGYRPKTKANLQRFIALLSQEGIARPVSSLGLAGWLTRLRRLYEGDNLSYLEYPVSRLADLPAFKEFIAEMINDAICFNKQYNATLAAYRRAHGYRYKVNPFPDLQRDETAAEYELPLWLVVDGIRAPAFVKYAQGQCLLHAGQKVVLAWTGRLSAEQLQGIALRPRGMSLTLFMRLFGCDLFLHGIGGAKYDGATSQFIRDYYGQEPPEYAGATLTLQPSLEVQEVSTAELRELEELIRDVEYNPDRHLQAAGLADHEQQHLLGLVKQKEALIAQIKVAGADRKTIGLEIKKLNQVIGSAVEGYRQALALRLEEKSQAFAAVEEAKRRDYAYFLFSPGEMAQFARQ